MINGKDEDKHNDRGKQKTNTNSMTMTNTSPNQEMDATVSKQSVFEKCFIWKCRSKYVEQTLKIYTALTRLVFKWTEMKNTQSHIMIS